MLKIEHINSSPYKLNFYKPVSDLDNIYKLTPGAESEVMPKSLTLHQQWPEKMTEPILF
jgi:hypothetical protein